MATPKTYTVKAGDTLSKIAAQNGVKLADITGYKSGNADKIGVGETLTIGGSPASSYVSEVKEQLTSDDPKPKDTSSAYDSTKLKTDRDSYKTNLDDALKTYEKAQTDAWDEEYNASGLGEKKEKMASIDSEIAAARQVRDDAISKVRANPGLSAAQMTGDIKKLSDYQNGIINNKIAERNGVASEYNTGLTEVQRKAEAKTRAAKTKYDYYAGLLSDTDSKIKDYQSSLAEQLKSETQSDQFDRQLAQALQIAGMKGSGGGNSNLQLKSDPNTGDPLYWFDPDTGAITYVNAGGGNDSGGDSYDSMGSDTPAPAAAASTPWYSKLWNAITGK